MYTYKYVDLFKSNNVTAIFFITWIGWNGFHDREYDIHSKQNKNKIPDTVPENPDLAFRHKTFEYEIRLLYNILDRLFFGSFPVRA
jgi:hypothetical protein